MDGQRKGIMCLRREPISRQVGSGLIYFSFNPFNALISSSSSKRRISATYLGHDLRRHDGVLLERGMVVVVLALEDPAA